MRALAALSLEDQIAGGFGFGMNINGGDNELPYPADVRGCPEVVSPAMWGSLLALALIGMLNPVRLAATLLVSSQPRPVHNLLAYWVGSLTMGIPVLVVPLFVLHFTPALRSFADDWATPGSSSTVRYIQLGLGLLALSSAALITVGSLARRRQPAPSATVHDNTPVLVPDSKPPPAISRQPRSAQDAVSEGVPAIRRLLGRAHDAWEKGSLWVSWAIGLLMGPAPDVVLFALAIIVASGAVIGTQVIGAIAYVVGLLAVVEIILVSYLVTPAKTQAALRRLHDWTSAHRWKLLVAILAVVGLSMLAHGMGM
jgi:Sap, sulfolipid-1-addressing protein